VDEHLLPDIARCTHVTIPDDIGLRNDDLEALLEHLYHDIPLSLETPFSRVASVLRASSPKQLDFPAIHELTQKFIRKMFPSGPQPFLHPDCLEEALVLATEYNLPIRKGVLYSLVTTSNFDTEGGEIDTLVVIQQPSPIKDLDSWSVMRSSADNHTLSSADAERCRRLMTGIVDHFTPILFTPATTSHMACTDVFADMWMSLVIQPALETDGVYKPLETLQHIIDIDWGKLGLCSSCVIEKRAEWMREQEETWKKADGWID